MDFINYIPEDNASSYETEDEDESYEHGTLQMIVDYDTAPPSKPTKMSGVIDDIVIGMGAVKLEEKKVYKKYGPDQIARLINTIQEEGLSIPKAAVLCGIPRSSAYKLVDEHNDLDGTVVPGSSKKARKSVPKKFSPEHSAFLIQLIDDNPSITLGGAREELYKKFEGMDVSLMGFYKHLVEKCNISLKQASKYTLQKDSPRTLNLRFEVITQWKSIGVDFQKNCVFVDEAGFHTQLMRNRAWSKIGDPAIVKVHTQKGINLSMIGCISPFGRINFSKVIPLKKEDAALIQKEFPQESGSKKKKNWQRQGTT
jgi:transposase